MQKAKVYFTNDLDSNALIKAFDAVNVKLNGKVAVKLHSGEAGNQNFLRPEYVKGLVEHVGGTVVECNTAYEGARTNNDDHMKLLAKHGWSRYFDVDLMDANGDAILEIPNGKVIKNDYVGKNLLNYDSMLVLCHAKGHPMGGYGNALKQLSIGCASRRGKAYIHGAGTTDDADYVWGHLPSQDAFLESMADAASAVHSLFEGRIVYVSVMKNLSVDCDCCAIAEDPCMKDIGVMASTDPVAIDQAFIDFVTNADDPGRDHFLERVNSRHGIHTIEAAAELGFGSRDYELIRI